MTSTRIKKWGKVWLLRIANKLRTVSDILDARYALGNNVKRRLHEAYRRDLNRFSKHAELTADGVFRPWIGESTSRESLAALIVMEYHRLEKCLSLPQARPGAGQDALLRLIAAAEHFIERFGTEYPIPNAAAVVKSYLEKNPTMELGQECIEGLSKLSEKYPVFVEIANRGKGGAKSLITKQGRFPVDSHALFSTRHSVRGFDDRKVERCIIEKVTKLAVYTPSVCNRQEWRLHAIDDRNMIKACLRFQNGNRGFTELIPLLFVVTVDLRWFVSVDERNQGWIDGGMFAMSLLWALHIEGLGGCALNWSASSENDLGLRCLLKLPDNEIVIMMIAAGYVPEDAKVAVSARRDVAEILNFHEPNAQC